MKLEMSLSGKIMITLFSILMIWDGISVYFINGEMGSVSAAIINLVGLNPFPFYAGVVVGHLFTNMWVSTKRLEQAARAYSDTNSLSNWDELESAIDELVNANHGWTRYFKK